MDTQRAIQSVFGLRKVVEESFWAVSGLWLRGFGSDVGPVHGRRQAAEKKKSKILKNFKIDSDENSEKSQENMISVHIYY